MPLCKGIVFWRTPTPANSPDSVLRPGWLTTPLATPPGSSALVVCLPSLSSIKLTRAWRMWLVVNITWLTLKVVPAPSVVSWMLVSRVPAPVPSCSEPLKAPLMVVLLSLTGLVFLPVSFLLSRSLSLKFACIFCYYIYIYIYIVCVWVGRAGVGWIICLLEKSNFIFSEPMMIQDYCQISSVRC